MNWLPLSPIPMKDRTSMIFLQYGQIDVIDGAFVLIDKTGIRTHIPVGSIACIMLEPGTRVSHAAVRQVPYWYGLVKQVYDFTPADSREARVQTDCCIRQSWRWMKNSG